MSAFYKKKRCNISELMPNALAFRGLEESLVTDLVFDTRDVTPGALFFALVGSYVNGHSFIQEAIKRGATVIVHSEDLHEYHANIAYVQVENTRLSMADIATRYYDNPAEQLTMIGITGTDGKSSTVSFTHALLEFADISSGFISTIALQIGNEIEANTLRQSTPEAPLIQKSLREMVDQNKKVAVIEATSHALDPRNARLKGLRFDVAILTNLSHEHLEFHGTFENYIEAKQELFRQLKPEGMAVLNTGCAQYPSFSRLCSSQQIVTYGMVEKIEKASRNSFITNYKQSTMGLEFAIKMDESEFTSFVPLWGAYNLENIQASLWALAFVSKKLKGHEDWRDWFDLVKQIESPEGRMNIISDYGQRYTALVDYAHTPGSFKIILKLMKESLSGSRLLVLFGSAGERDKQKRPIQGKIADEYADIIVLTEEDNRKEEAMVILEEIAAGVTQKTEGETLFLIEDRYEAMQKIVSLALPGDIVLTLGKGHERSIIGFEGKRPWNEKEKLSTAILQALKFEKT